MKIVFSVDVRIFLAGDYNSNHLLWGLTLKNVFGRNSDIAFSSSNVTVYSQKDPTFFDTGFQPHFLNITLSKGIAYNIIVRSVADISLDHNSPTNQLRLRPATFVLSCQTADESHFVCHSEIRSLRWQRERIKRKAQYNTFPGNITVANRLTVSSR